MEALNQHLFLLLNAPPVPSAGLLLLARFLANDVVMLITVLAAVLWVRGRRNGRATLVGAGCALLIAAALNATIGALWHHPRPFMIGLGHQLIPHAANSSFPSDHATFMWTIGISLLLRGSWPRLGWGMMAFGVGVAWARIYLGVHFPLDMAGALLISAVASLLVIPAGSFVDLSLTPALIRLYEGAVRRLHLPKALFPLDI
ncbi:phosphatase PAP2 family protein [Azospirillum sp. B506]|uniref:phosphatase PAP2 family protein n=1 Tax=Azospirillum sp. B506 TaxID=137721 RepID=UPI00034D54C2|nr:phosphatase PAP2 family protein [Azospirillum sp. B506]